MELNPNYDPFGPNVVCWEKGQHGGRTRPIDREALFANLCSIHEVFDDYGISHWLSHGTMLGVYRDGDFIPWDDDADLGLYFQDRESKDYKKALKVLTKKGFYIPPCDPRKPISKDNAPYYDFVAIKDGEKVEGWFFEKFADQNCYIYDKPRCGNTLKHDAKYYTSLVTIKFKEVEFNIPNHIEDWLVMMYGENWRTPDKNAKYNHQS